MIKSLISKTEYTITAIRASGPGGQHVNKVSTGIALSFDIQASSLEDRVKLKLLSLNDNRITNSGVIKIKATSFKSRVQNKKDAIARLEEMIHLASIKEKKRKKSKIPKAIKEARLREKSRKSDIKELRRKPDY